MSDIQYVTHFKRAARLVTVQAPRGNLASPADGLKTLYSIYKYTVIDCEPLRNISTVSLAEKSKGSELDQTKAPIAGRNVYISRFTVSSSLLFMTSRSLKSSSSMLSDP